MTRMQHEELRQAAQQAVLQGLPAGTTLADIEAAVGRSHVRGYSPDLAMLELVIAALDVADAGPEQRLSTAGWRERYLPEVTFHNRFTEVDRLVYALHAATAFRAGLRPDILNDIYGWNAVQLWPYATRAAVMTIRAIADGHDLQATCVEVGRAVRALEP